MSDKPKILRYMHGEPLPNKEIDGEEGILERLNGRLEAQARMSIQEGREQVIQELRREKDKELDERGY